MPPCQDRFISPLCTPLTAQLSAYYFTTNREDGSSGFSNGDFMNITLNPTLGQKLQMTLKEKNYTIQESLPSK